MPFSSASASKQPLGGDVLVAGLLGDLLGLVENARKLARRRGLAGAAARDLRPLGEVGIDGQERRLGVAARLADETCGHALAVVEQRLQEMLGRELLVAFAQRDGLRRLHETAGAVRIHLEIHASLLEHAPLRPCGTEKRLLRQDYGARTDLGSLMSIRPKPFQHVI